MYLGKLRGGVKGRIFTFFFYPLLHLYAANIIQTLFSLSLSTCTTVVTGCMCFSQGIFPDCCWQKIFFKCGGGERADRERRGMKGERGGGGNGGGGGGRSQ